MPMYAGKTTVAVDKTKADIERLLARYGAARFAYMSEPGSAVIMFEYEQRTIRFRLPLPLRSDYETLPSGRMRGVNATTAAYEQGSRQRWRALYLLILAKLEAIESGIVSFEDEFLAESVMPGGRTVGEWLEPQLTKLFVEGKIPPLLPGPKD